MADTKKAKTISLSRPILLVLIAFVFALGIFLGRSAWLFTSGADDRGESVPQTALEEFRFIRQSILPEPSPDGRKIKELKPFRYKVNSLIEEKVADGEALSVAVYFRDLDNGNWFGIHDEQPFSPESQLKLPLMLAYYKWAEANPLVLRKRLQVVLPAERETPTYLRPPKTVAEGKKYSVNELIFRMIAYGDTDAYAVLAANLPPKHQQKIYRDLYVNYDPSKKDDVLSLSAYASFFRVLFNASYLSEEMSEKALRYLSRNSFRGGMAAGIPPDITLASKAGERFIATGDEGPDVVQLHEFGLVYHPQRPFLLGITVQGTDYDDIANVLRDITKLIYNEVDRQSS
ncbi:MAG: serine hydrolase [Nitrospiraceae bacterium]|nr:serine hydrolase [Nitrospiraceae bacterium]